MLWKILYWLTAGALFMILATEHAQASVIISEVAPAPVSGPEWVELYNTSPESIDLTNWHLKDHLTSPVRIFDFTADATQPDRWLLAPNTFLVVNLSSAKLNNGGDGVSLFTPEQQISTSMNYSSSTAGKTWSLTATSNDTYVETDPNPHQFATPPPSASPSPTQTPSPTATPPVTPSPSPNQSAQLFDTTTVSLSSYHPCPSSGEKEWLALTYSGTEMHTFDDWILTDESGNTKTLAGTLVPNEITTLNWSGALLNNSGDSFTLHTAQSKLIASASYQSCTGEIKSVLTTNTATDSATLAENNSKSTPNPTTDTILDTTQSKTINQNQYTKYISHLTPPGPDSYSLTQDDLVTSYQKIWIKHEPSLLGVRSVILGGSLLLASAAVLLYQPSHNNNSLPALYVETLT